MYADEPAPSVGPGRAICHETEDDLGFKSVFLCVSREMAGAQETSANGRKLIARHRLAPAAH